MAELFCCLATKPYRPQRLDHEAKFDRFMQWAKYASSVPSDSFHLNSNLEYAIQLVKQVNFGPQESIRYFAPASSDSGFIEITENDLLEANFEKLNSFKNFKCGSHNKFFEVNLYQKNPINRHHWRANLARPSTDIDLSLKQQAEKKSSDVRAESSTLPPDPMSDASGSNSPKAILQAEENANKFESAAVKSALRILLPTVKTNLGSKPLASLLCLDWVNEELGLGLNLEKDWQTQLTLRNIATFIFDYSRLSDAGSVTLAAVEHSVDQAMRINSLIKNQQLLPGRKQFQEIVYRVLKGKITPDWMSKNREAIMRTFTAGPNEQLLELFHHKDEEEQISSLTDKFKLNVGDESGDDDSQYDDDTNRYEEYHDDDVGSYASDFEDKDLTACDKECGYCGRCPY